jgi:hypothetical protein
MILLLDWWFWQRRRPLGTAWWRRRLLRCYLPILLVLLGYLAARQVVLGQLTSGAVVKRTENPINLPADMLGDEESEFLVRWATPLYTFAKASWMMVWPWPLIHDYSIPALPAIRRFEDPRLWIGVAWLAVFLMILVWSYARNRKLLVALGLALVPYSIVSNFVIIIGTIFGERLLYAPSVGACMAFGLILRPVLRPILAERRTAQEAGVGESPIPRRLPRALVSAVLLAVVAATYGYLVVNRNQDWSSPAALVRSVGDDERTSFKVLGALSEKALKEGRQHLADGDAEAARAAFERALEYAKRGLAIAPEAWGPHSAYGIALWYLGENTKALDAIAYALSRGAGGDPNTLFAAAHLLVEVKGDYRQGIDLLELVLQRHPTPWVGMRAHNDLAMFLISAPEGLRREPGGRPVRDPERALLHAEEAVRLQPRDGAIRDTLVQVLLALGRRDEAVAELRRALEEIPAADPYRPQLQAMLQDLTAG